MENEIDIKIADTVTKIVSLLDGFSIYQIRKILEICQEKANDIPITTSVLQS